jgi:hypothetical protein
MGATMQPSAALDYSRHPKDSPTVNAILARGKIVDGDTYDLKRYIKSLPVKPTTVIYLESPGGNVAESMELGRYFYANKIQTYVDARKECTSACAIAFLGGRGPDGKPNRIKSSTGKLGFHSFTREFSDRDRYTSDDMKQVLQRAQTQVGVISEYLRDIEADLDVLRIMLTATNRQMNYVSNDDAIGVGIQVYDEKTNALVDPAPVLERLAKARAAARVAANTPATNPKPDPDTPKTTPNAPKTSRTPGAAVPTSGGSDAPNAKPERRHATPAPTRTRPVAATGGGVPEGGTR